MQISSVLDQAWHGLKEQPLWNKSKPLNAEDLAFSFSTVLFISGLSEDVEL